jgi:hypothetical protein
MKPIAPATVQSGRRGRRHLWAGVPFVDVDDRGGARRAAEHLLGLGDRRTSVFVDRIAADAYRGPVDSPTARDGWVRRRPPTAGQLRRRLGAAGLAWLAVPIQE